MSNFDYHEMKQPGKCRGCSSTIEKGTEVLHTYTSVGRGMHIFLCDDCQLDIWNMMTIHHESENELGQKLVMKKLST